MAYTRPTVIIIINENKLGKELALLRQYPFPGYLGSATQPSRRASRYYTAVLPADECCKTMVFVGRSTMLLAKAGNRVFEGQNFGKKGMAGTFYGSLAYADLGQKPRSRKQYTAKHMEATAESFQK